MSDTFTYLPPSDDGVFKTLMTHPGARNALRSVISSFTNIAVTQVDVVNNELHIGSVYEGQERFDVNCVVDRNAPDIGGRQIEVEMQAEPMSGDNSDNAHANLLNRVISYLCDLHAKQKGEGVPYGELMPSIQITICDYTVLPNEADFVNVFTLRNKGGYELNKAITLIIVELSKLAKIAKKPVVEMTDAEKWAVFFKYADKPKYSKVITDITTVKEEVMEATQILSGISKDEQERFRFRAREKFRRDIEHNRIMGIRMALNEERARAEAKASAERIEAAKSFISQGFPFDKVVSTLKLTPAEIAQLRQVTV